MEKTMGKKAGQRFIGTTIGALYGLLYLLIRNRYEGAAWLNEWLDGLFISVMIVIVLKVHGYTEELKILMYDSDDYPGYAYIKIYNKNARKENMVKYLKNMLGIEKTVTFGSIPGRYDVCVESGDVNKVVHVLEKMYEPFFFFQNKE